MYDVDRSYVCNKKISQIETLQGFIFDHKLLIRPKINFSFVDAKRGNLWVSFCVTVSYNKS